MEISRIEAAKLLKTNMDVFRNNVRKKMLEKKITDELLADMIESNRPYINYLLNRRSSNTSLDMVGKISAALECKISELIS